jgi:hypothetical protein
MTVMNMKASERYKLGLFNYLVTRHEVDEKNKAIDVYELAWTGEIMPKRFKVKDNKVIYDEDDRTKDGRRESILALQADSERIV